MERNGHFGADAVAGVLASVAVAAATAGVLAGGAGPAWGAGRPAPRVEVHADWAPPGAAGAGEGTGEGAAGAGSGGAPVCVFYLDAVGFPAGGRVRWSIGRAGAGGTPLRADTIPLGAAGSGVTENMRLGADGTYALRWAEGGTAGGSDFTVACGRPAGGPPGDGGRPGAAPAPPVPTAVSSASARRGALAEASGLAAGLPGLTWAAAALLLAGCLLLAVRRT